jgi:hypothetical protein
VIHRKKALTVSKCRVHETRSTVIPRPLGSLPLQARPVVSITYRSTVQWRTIWRARRRGTDCGIGPPRAVNTSATGVVFVGVPRIQFYGPAAATAFSGTTMKPHVLTQPAPYPFAIFGVGRSSCLRRMIWTVDREPIFQNAESSIFGCVGNAPRPCTDSSNGRRSQYWPTSPAF